MMDKSIPRIASAGLFLLAIIQPFGKLEAQDESSRRVGVESIRAAIVPALSLLEVASAGSAERRVCFTCHGQALPVMALAEARVRGFEIDEQNFHRQLDHTAAFLKRGHKNYLSGKGQGGRVDTAGYALWALEAGARQRSDITDAVTEYLLTTDANFGHWKHSSDRPPSEASDYTTTYLALRALAEFGTAQQQPRIADRQESVSKWLMETKPRDTEDRAFQLRAISYLASQAESKGFADDLITQQRDDGGWAQMAEMESDAYATATVLVSLARTEHLLPSSETYQRGLRFLIDTQHEDGSWRVATRSKPFQKHFESGFPHGKDQFISTTATAWSAIALLIALPE